MGIRYHRDNEVFYLLHEDKMVELLVRAHRGEDPDELLIENWIVAEKGEDGGDIVMMQGSAVIRADMTEETGDDESSRLGEGNEEAV